MKKIRMAIVGCNFGKWIVKDSLPKENAAPWIELAGVCDQVPEKAAAVAQMANVRTYATLDDILRDDSVEAVGLYTPPVGRADLIRKIIRGGKHVLTTKPFELDADAGLAVLKEAEKLGKVIHLNSPSPVLPDDLRKVQEWRQKYDLGRPVGCRADVWASYFEKKDGSWYDDPKRCPVSPVFRLGIYLINDLSTILGAAESVQVTHSRIRTERPTPDNAQLTLLYANGAIGSIYASYCVGDQDHYRNGLIINFERGTIYRDVGPERVMEAGKAELKLVGGTENNRKVLDSAMVYRSGEYLWEAFYRAIREGMKNDLTAEQIVDGIRIIAAMSRAEESGKTERINN